jgi:hypothetical protein
MKTDPLDIPKLRPELHLTAALHLLSAIARQGGSDAKVGAMLGHLHRLMEDPQLDATLLDTVTRLVLEWHGDGLPAVAQCHGGITMNTTTLH